jgi:sugar transferase (PEP-CTERM/EpsH1 system associated)
MRALILSPTFVWPPDSGAKIRIFHTIKHLSRRFDLTLLSLAGDSKPRELGPLAEWCQNVRVVPRVVTRNQALLRSAFSLRPYRVVKFWTRRFQEAVETELERGNFDVIWVNFQNMVGYVPPCLAVSTTVILDQHNADELMWMRFASQGALPRRLFAKWNLLKSSRFQRQVLRYVDVLVSVSQDEADFMRQRVRAGVKIWVVPNGVDATHFQPRPQALRQGNVILFCGSMDVTMNIDAVCYFVSKIFPVIRGAVPDAEFWIVGRNPNKDVRQLNAQDGVRVTGAVEDVRPFYEGAKVAVVPFRFGAGTKLKVLEAMAMGVPTVSTSTGCQGIDAEEGKEIWIVDDPEAFADTVVKLLLDEQAGLAMREAARRLVEERYDWGSIFRSVGDALIEEVSHKHRGGDVSPSA